MKTKLMLIALLGSAAIAQAGPPISPAKVKKPLHISQINGIFHHTEPSASAQPGSTGEASSGGAAPVDAVPAAPAKPRAKLRPFLNHPVTAPGPH